MDKIDDVAHQIVQTVIPVVRQIWLDTVPPGHLTSNQFCRATKRALALYRHLLADGSVVPDWPLDDEIWSTKPKKRPHHN